MNWCVFCQLQILTCRLLCQKTTHLAKRKRCHSIGKAQVCNDQKKKLSSTFFLQELLFTVEFSEKFLSNLLPLLSKAVI